LIPQSTLQVTLTPYLHIGYWAFHKELHTRLVCELIVASHSSGNIDEVTLH